MNKRNISKIIIFIFMISSIFCITTNVSAKEINLNDLVDNLEISGTMPEISLNEGDQIVYNPNVGDHYIPTIRIYYVDPISGAEESFGYIYERQDGLDFLNYTIPSYEELIDEPIPKGKICTIYLDIQNTCTASFPISINYTLADDVEKYINYHNTYDAINENPTNYYEGEADFVLKDLERDGYKFLGWYTKEDFDGDSRITMITADLPETIDVYAKWEKIETNNVIIKNPETNTMVYVIGGIIVMVSIATLLVIIYRKNNKKV